MKLIVNLGKGLEHAKIKLPTTVPVFSHYDADGIRKRMGEAVISRKEDSSEIEGELSFNKYEDMKDLLELGCMGRITEQEGNVIKGFDLISVSMQPKIK